MPPCHHPPLALTPLGLKTATLMLWGAEQDGEPLESKGPCSLSLKLEEDMARPTAQPALVLDARCNGVRAGHAHPSACCPELLPPLLSLPPDRDAALGSTSWASLFSWPVSAPSNPHRGALSHYRSGPFPCPSALSTGTTAKKPVKQSQLGSPDSPNDPIPRVSFESLGFLSEIPRSYQQFSDYILRFQSSIMKFLKSWSLF